MKRLNKVLHKCFRKVGQKKKKVNIKHEHLYNRWKLLKSKDDSKDEMKETEAELADTYFEKISDATSDISCDEEGMSSGKLWNLKKQLFPRSRDPPTAMLDTSENLVTNVENIKKLAVEAYKERLRSRPMKEGMEDVREAKEKLTKQLLEKAANNKTPSWSMNDLDEVLNKLKNDKSKDKNGLANELFKREAAGSDLILAILKLMNRIKSEQIYPKSLELCNISIIWKMKGPRNRSSE